MTQQLKLIPDPIDFWDKMFWFFLCNYGIWLLWTEDYLNVEQDHPKEYQQFLQSINQ